MTLVQKRGSHLRQVSTLEKLFCYKTLCKKKTTLPLFPTF